jgi:hypothetical protein
MTSACYHAHAFKALTCGFSVADVNDVSAKEPQAMSSIEPYTAVNGGLLRDARRAGRAINRYQSGGQVRVAQVDVETDVALAKVEAITHTTGQAMGAVVRVAQAQRHLEQLAPEAAGRLNFLADDHMLSMSDVMADLRRDLRRR